ncbi:hypothetical protein MAJ_10429, partial [Metarhizium majus ARSEF 297]
MSVHWTQTFSKICTGADPKCELVITEADKELAAVFLEEFVRRMIKRGTLRIRGSPPIHGGPRPTVSSIRSKIAHTSAPGEEEMLERRVVKDWVHTDGRRRLNNVNTTSMLSRISDAGWNNVLTDDAYLGR